VKRTCLIISIVLLVLLVVSLTLALFQKNIPLGNRVALVRVEGPIMDSTDVVDEIKEHVKDHSIKAIILRIDSPGGAVAPSQEIYEEVKKASEEKHVVVSMGSIAASGGYYIAAPADVIIANPGTLTGSIGVIMEIPNLEGLMSKIGISTEVIKSGKHKDMASAFRKMEKEDRDILQGVMDNVHEQFIRAVAEGRKLKVEEIRPIADGRIFSGEQAKGLKLVDEIGTLEFAISKAAELAGISGEPEVVSKKEKLSIMDALRSKFPKEIADIFPSVKIKFLYTP
jgi:protease IV